MLEIKSSRYNIMKALRFYSSVRVEVSKVSGSNVKEKRGTDELIVGHRIRIKVSKNKVGMLA